MTPEQILQIIKSHQAEYTAEAEEQYRLALTSDRVSDSAIHSEVANFAVAKAAALSRILLEMTDLDAAVAHLLDAETVMKRARDRDGLPPNSEVEP